MPKIYGLNFPEEIEIQPITAELIAFREGQTRERGGMGRYIHFKNVCKHLYPEKFQEKWWHDWMCKRIKSLCEEKVNAWTGAGASGKTHDAALYAMIFWLCDPDNTSVILTSTTGKMVRKRIWPVIQELYSNMKINHGNLVDSKTTLQSRKGDDKHGIFAMAVREGPTSKAVADIQGLHAPRMLIVIDEGTDTPEAILEAIPNLRKGCKDFRLLIIGNAASHLDPHGRLCEPKDGWGSVSVEDEDWETKGMPDWEIDPGVCLHFDGVKSPNVKAGKDNWPFLLTIADLNRSLQKPHAEESIGFWKFTRGFWPPEGSCNTVLSDQIIERNDGRGRFTFMRSAVNIAGLDPGFGGDDAVLRIGRMGDLEDGRTAIQLLKTIKLTIKVNAKEYGTWKPIPIEEQIVNQTRQLCLENEVKPRNLGVDSTFRGGTLSMQFARDWSSDVVCVDFGGVPSDRAISNEDQRTAKEVYDRKVTELWFNIREFVVHGLLRGMESEEIKQLCRREYSDKQRKIVIETKKEYKEKNGSQSPNEADALAILIAVARNLGATPAGGTNTSQTNSWLDIALKKDDINVVEDDELQSNEDPFELQLM